MSTSYHQRWRTLVLTTTAHQKRNFISEKFRHGVTAHTSCALPPPLLCIPVRVHISLRCSACSSGVYFVSRNIPVTLPALCVHFMGFGATLDPSSYPPGGRVRRCALLRSVHRSPRAPLMRITLRVLLNASLWKITKTYENQ